MACGSKVTSLLAFWAVLIVSALPVSGQIITYDVPSSTTAPNNPSRKHYDDKQLFLLLNVGMAAPTGVFGSTNVLEEDAVYAKTGFNIHVNVGRTFNRFLGITATGGFINQTTKMEVIVDNFNRFGPPGVFILDYDYPGMSFLYAAGGLLVTVPATDRFSIDLKLQGGFAFGIDRELTLRIDDNAIIRTEKYGKATDLAFLPDFGLNFRALVTDNFTMNFFTDFLMANFKFKDVTYFENGVAVGTFDYKLPMRNVNVGIGAGWSF